MSGRSRRDDVSGWVSQDPALLLIAHGSRDARSVAAIRHLAGAVAAARPETTVRHAFLELSQPAPAAVLRDLAAAGHRDVVAVPLLLTSAYHSRVDVPEVLATAPPSLAVRRADVLGPDGRLLDGLVRLLAGAPEFDALVLAAAGSSDQTAVTSIRDAASQLGRRYGVPALAGFASAAPLVSEAVRQLRAAGALRVAVASYFLAPGLLYDRVVAGANDAGAVAVTEPLVGVPELAAVVLDRYAAAAPPPARFAA